MSVLEDPGSIPGTSTQIRAMRRTSSFASENQEEVDRAFSEKPPR
jgi:hypothetical protein